MTVPRFAAARRSAALAAAFLMLVLLSSPALAQFTMQQLGPVRAGQIPMYVGNGQVIGTAGVTAPGQTPANQTTAGTLPPGIAVVNPGQGIVAYSGYANGTPYSELKLGFDGAGNALLTVDTVGGGPAQSFGLQINGNTYMQPGPGGGNLLGPGSVTPGNVAVWLSPTTLQDLGIAPVTSLPALTVLGNAASLSGGLSYIPMTGTGGSVVMSAGTPVFTGTPYVRNALPTSAWQSTVAPSNGGTLGYNNYNAQDGATYVATVASSPVVTPGVRQGRWSLLAMDPGTNALATAIDVYGSTVTLGSTLTAPNLSTAGTIAGSLCRTGAGLFIYKAGANCY